MKNMQIVFLMWLLQFAAPACTAPDVVISPPGYDLSKPKIYKMPSVLEEISGIALNHGKTDTIYAEQDEEGKLFYFHLGDTEIKHTKFSKRGDYEDVAISNGLVIMLRSDGVFFTFPLSEIANKDAGNVIEQPGLLPQGEYESLYADDKNHVLYALCKNSSADKDAEVISGYVFLIGSDGKLTLKDHFSIDEKAVATLAGKEKIRFKPAALARNPVTGQWYIISSVNKILLITDAKWKPLNTYPLNPSLFFQPEGIAFDNAGNMFIASEKGNGNAGTILQFTYQKK